VHDSTNRAQTREGRWDKKRLDITRAKFSVAFPERKLPAIDPADPRFVLVLSGLEIHGKVNPKAPRKLAQHRGGAVLQGEGGRRGRQAQSPRRGFTWTDPKPEASIDGGAP
jgi:hypothetical protein